MDRVAVPMKLPVGRITAALYTSPHGSMSDDPELALVALVKSARRSIRFAIYSLTLPDVAAAIIDAHHAGLNVRGVADANTWNGSTSKLQQLADAGVDIRKWGGNYRLMHDKVAVVDGMRCAIGSYNWTAQAEKSNVECLVIASSSRLALALTGQVENTYQQGVAP